MLARRLPINTKTKLDLTKLFYSILGISQSLSVRCKGRYKTGFDKL